MTEERKRKLGELAKVVSQTMEELALTGVAFKCVATEAEEVYGKLISSRDSDRATALLGNKLGMPIDSESACV